MPQSNHLLFGILAYQNQLICKDELLQAVHTWLKNKSHTIDQILLQNQAITEGERNVLDQLLTQLVLKQGDDDSISLAVGTDTETLLHELRQHEDPDIFQTIGHSATPRIHAPSVISSSNLEAGRSRFRILRKHDEGGLGKVSVALDTQLDREVAFKEIKPLFADDEVSRIRFSREAEITGKLEHPGVVPIYGLGVYEDGRPYYAMRFIKGNNLSHAIESFHEEHRNDSQLGKSLEFRRLLGRFLDVCNAVHFAHKRGVLHRDLKPGNIMLGEFGETLVVDWGLAKYYEARLATESIGQSIQANDASTRSQSYSGADDATILGAAIGSPHYMSPEQARGEHDRLGPTTDVYSLGATLFALLTNTKPINGSSIKELMKQVQLGPEQTAREVNEYVDPALSAICERAMAIKPTERYQSVLKLADDIERYLNDDPVRAYADPWSAVARRWVRKHPRLAESFAAGVLIAAASFFVFAAYQGAMAKIQEQNAERIAEKNEKLIMLKVVADNATKDAIAAEEIAKGRLKDAEEAELKAVGALSAMESVLKSSPEMVDHLLTVVESSDDQALVESAMQRLGRRLFASLMSIRVHDNSCDFTVASSRIAAVESLLETYLEQYEPDKSTGSSVLSQQIDDDMVMIAVVCNQLAVQLGAPINDERVQEHLASMKNRRAEITRSKANPLISRLGTWLESKNTYTSKFAAFMPAEDSMDLEPLSYSPSEFRRVRDRLAKQFKANAKRVISVALRSGSESMNNVLTDGRLSKPDELFSVLKDDPEFIEWTSASRDWHLGTGVQDLWQTVKDKIDEWSRSEALNTATELIRKN